MRGFNKKGSQNPQDVIQKVLNSKLGEKKLRFEGMKIKASKKQEKGTLKYDLGIKTQSTAV